MSSSPNQSINQYKQQPPGESHHLQLTGNTYNYEPVAKMDTNDNIRISAYAFGSIRALATEH